MSKINVPDVIRQSGLNCEYEGRPGKAVLITDRMVAENAADESAAYPEVDAGEILVSYRDEGRVRGKVLSLEAGNDIVVIVREADAEEATALAVGSHSELLDSVRAAAAIQPAGERDRRAVETVQEYASEVFARALAHTRDPELRATILSFQLERSRMAEPEEQRLSPEEMDKISTARSLRQAIGRQVPDHPDALVEDDAGYRSQGLARGVLNGLDLSGRDFGPQQMGAIRADRRLSEEVFGAMTTTPISDLTAQMLSPSDFAKIRQEMRPGRVSGKFVEVIGERLDSIFKDRMPGYQRGNDNGYNIEFYRKDGADLLLVDEPWNRAHYVYGWDAESTLLEIPKADALILTKADVPTDEEIARLREVLADVRYEIGDAPEFESFNQEFTVGDDLGREIGDAFRDNDENPDFDNHDDGTDFKGFRY